jgi:hypothetical protein
MSFGALGMARQGYDVQLTRQWRRGLASDVRPSGKVHCIVAGAAWELTPGRG